MISTHFHTNIDCLKGREEWPQALETVPRVGDLIRSATKHFQHHDHYGQMPAEVELEVVRVTWVKYKERWSGGVGAWGVKIELRLPPNRFPNVSIFEKWYKSLT